jgi:hypothetical protein
VWTRLHKLGRRPAPRGARPAAPRHDTPPDGWEVVGSSWPDRLGVRLDSAVLHLADAAARATSRRMFLAGAGAVGTALAGLAGSRVFWGTTPALAGHQVLSCNAFGGNDMNPEACGPSAPCPSAHCVPHDDILGASWCRNALAAVTWRNWGQTECVSADAHSCWQEDCCKQYGGIAMCCDCCSTTNVGSGGCTSCESATRYKCVCDGRRQNC